MPQRGAYYVCQGGFDAKNELYPRSPGRCRSGLQWDRKRTGAMASIAATRGKNDRRSFLPRVAAMLAIAPVCPWKRRGSALTCRWPFSPRLSIVEPAEEAFHV